MLRWIARAILRLMGWSVYGEKPPVPKAVIIGAPHTSNVDAIVMVMAAIVLRADLKWLVKDSIYDTPLRPVLKWAGAIPITRKGGQNVVEQVVEIFRQSDRLLLALAPEGTRKRTEGWRTGFYYIALSAQIPIYFGFVDYKRKQVGIGGHIQPTGDIELDMQQIRAFYQEITPRFPENFGEIRLLPRKTETTVRSE